MRPANLIPVEERHQRGQGIRAAPLAYLLVGALLLALGAVTATVVTDNQISSRKDEVTEARRATAAAERQAAKLSAYTQFHAAAVQRTETISNLADSRFDWAKVMRQLAVIKPDDAWVTKLSGSVGPEVGVDGGENIALRASIPGPALSISGCAKTQRAVAGFVTALRDIDGVTRVGVQTSGRTGGEGGSSSSATCPAVSFQMVAAFDAAPIPTPILGAEVPTEAAAPEAAPEAESEPTSPTPEGE